MRDHDRGFLVTVSKHDRAYHRKDQLAVHGTSCGVGMMGQGDRVFFGALHGGVV